MLRRYVDSKLYLQVLSVLREDEVNFGSVPAGVMESLEKYMALIREHSLFDYTQIIRSAVDYVDGDRYETTTLRASRTTSAMTSATSLWMSIKT